MSTLEELKREWEMKGKVKSGHIPYDEKSFDRIIKSRVKKHISISMKYFWASFVLQLVVYALLGHVIVRYWNDGLIVLVSVCGILLYIPFMIVLMKKFKAMASTKMKDQTGSIQSFVQRQHDLLQSFYRFKRRYELFLIPSISAIGVWIVFRLWVPGGVGPHFEGAGIAFVITIISCIVAINKENRQNFEEPLSELSRVLDEFKSEE